MMTIDKATEPELRPIKNGWAAYGDGWAVHGATREEAIQKYREAEEWHRMIDALPYWYERHPSTEMHEEEHGRG